MDASSTSVMFSMDVSSPSRPLLGAYRTDPVPASRVECANDSVTLTGTSDTFRQLQLDFHREAAHRYDSWAGGANVRAAERLASFADVQAHERVVDIGCGTGLVSRALGIGGSNLDHMAVDLSPDMITYARAQAPGQRGIQYSV